MQPVTVTAIALQSLVKKDFKKKVCYHYHLDLVIIVISTSFLSEFRKSLCLQFGSKRKGSSILSQGGFQNREKR